MSGAVDQLDQDDARPGDLIDRIEHRPRQLGGRLAHEMPLPVVTEAEWQRWVQCLDLEPGHRADVATDAARVSHEIRDGSGPVCRVAPPGDEHGESGRPVL